jgi:hypothetical protein
MAKRGMKYWRKWVKKRAEMPADEPDWETLLEESKCDPVIIRLILIASNK